MKVIPLKKIQECFHFEKIIQAIERSFVQYSNSTVLSTPVSRFHFQNANGDLHIKSGMFAGDDYFIVKIASGFYDNWKKGIPSSQGIMVAINTHTGKPEIILDDEGYLTDMRTAIASLICVKYLAPVGSKKIGIFGTGTQAFLQAKLLKLKFPEIEYLTLWGRSEEKLGNAKAKFQDLGFSVQVTTSAQYVAENSNLIITATPSTQPLLFGKWLKPGTHITAIGADDPHKQELDVSVFEKANHVIVDSVSQCIEFGDTAHAMKVGCVQKENLIELGNLISGSISLNQSPLDITIADLTGLAAQDIAIAKYILENLGEYF
jgi:ornithine cyclodeaminase